MSKGGNRDERMMQECLALAERGAGSVSPNPMVGAVLVKGGGIVSQGWHQKFGGPHAEAVCLDAYKGDPAGGTLYVSLEPCSHVGKTPPCADMILRSGISRVVVAMQDPNPLVAGKGIRKLRSGGVRVEVGVCAREAARLNRFFIKAVTSGLPYVCVKIAQTVDGYIGGEGAPRWLTSPEARTMVHQWRSRYDAVLVGAGTVRTDDPDLTVRLVRGRNPDVVIMDGLATIPASSRILTSRRRRRVFVVVDDSNPRGAGDRVNSLEAAGAIMVPLPARHGRVPLESVLRALVERNIASVFVEGGAEIFTQFRESRLVDEERIFVAPFTLGGGIPASVRAASRIDDRKRTTIVRQVGRDTLYTVNYQ
jgi:diaminohydroxyphosphoribosylaminopyrimidine deaminase/5-amino-6-(5-phosphoribosylamino)uracil reductase